MGSSNRVSTTETSLEIIEVIKENDGATITELTTQFDVSRSTVYKHLNTLTEHGLLIKEGNTYHIGWRFFNLGEYARRRKTVSAIIERRVQELYNTVNEDVDYLIESNGMALTLFRSHHPTENQRYSGRYYHMNYVAGGKAILSQLSRNRIEEIASKWGLPKRTENTIHTLPDLLAEVSTIAEQGYAISDEEFERGLRAVAVPVVDPLGENHSAIVVSGPTYRLSLEKLSAEIANQLMEAKTELETAIREHELSG